MAVNMLPWGNTCPLLKIAQHYGVDYAVPLYLADYLQHDRSIPLSQFEAFAVPLPTIDKIRQDVRYVCQWMADVREGSIRL